MNLPLPLLLLAAAAALLLLGWIGLKIPPRPFPPFPTGAPPMETLPLPSSLPAPVERFYRALYGEQAPRITSAVISGRGRLRLGGLTFQARFRFTHVAGQAYRHYIEATFFGLPLMRVNEHYLEGKARLELPVGVSEGSKIDQGANLALWAESIWLPTVWITDPRLRWEPVNEDTALLAAPFGSQEEIFVIRFNPQTGLLHILESMRYKDEASQAKILWINEVRQWSRVSGGLQPAESAVTWQDDGKPWAVFFTEEVVYNAPVETYVRARGA